MEARFSQDFEKMVRGFGLTTMDVTYDRLDFPSMVQTFTYQQYDLWPKFPYMRRVIECISSKTRVRRVIIAHARLIKPAELRMVGAEFRLH